MSPNFHSWIILNGKWVLWSISFELSPINHAWKSSIGPCCITARDSAPAESKTLIFLHFCRLRINVRLRDISFDWQWIYFGYPYVRIAWIIQLNFHPVQYLAEYVFKSNRNCVRRDRDTMSFRWRTTRGVLHCIYIHLTPNAVLGYVKIVSAELLNFERNQRDWKSSIKKGI